jgi:TonB family protein
MNIKDRVVSKSRFFAHLRALAASKKTGTLIVTLPGVERRLYFEQGAIVAATSNLREESMGYLLAERDIVKANKVKQAEDLLGNKPSLLGRRLVQLGAMSEHEIVNAVRLKIRETISNILASPEAEVTLNDETFPEVDRVPVSIDVQQLLAAGIEAAEKKIVANSEETLALESTEETIALTPEPEEIFGPPDETDDPDSQLIQALEGFTEKYSREATIAPRTAGPITRPYAVVPEPRTGSHARLARTDRSPVGLVAAGIVGVALLGGGYWFFTRSSGESATTVAERVAVPSVTETGPTSEPAAPVETQAEPVANAPSENSQPGASVRSAPAPARPSPAPMRESVPTPAARQTQPAPATATPRQQASVPAAPRQAPTPPRVETSAPPAPAQREPEPEPPTKSSTAETEQSRPEPPAPTQPATPPSAAGQPQQAQQTPQAPQAQQTQQAQQAQQTQQGAEGNWGSAVFAPKQASVGAAPKRDPGLQTGDYVEPSFDVIEPVLIEHPKLEYPEEAKRQKIPEAVVRVRVLVDHTGAVQEAEIVKAAGHGFDEVALAAAAQAKFIPATKGQVQVKTWTVLPLVFRLED